MNPSENTSAIYIPPDVIVCEVCQKIFDNDALLRKHMPLHRIACLMCMRPFANRQKLLRHLHVRDEDETVRCCSCKLRYASISEMNSHDCFGMYPYYCGHCLKGFGKLDIYEEHMVLHVDLVSYDCRFCGKKFPYENGLIRHEKFTHAIEMQQDTEYAGSSRSSDSDLDINPHEATFIIDTSPDAASHGSGINCFGPESGTSGSETVRRSSEFKFNSSKPVMSISGTEGCSSELINVVLDISTNVSGVQRNVKYEPKVTRALTKQKTEESKQSRSVSKPKTRKAKISTGKSMSPASTSESSTGVCTPEVKEITKGKNDTPNLKRGKTGPKKTANNEKQTEFGLDGSKFEKNRLQAANREPDKNIGRLKAEPLNQSDGLVSSIEQNFPERELDLNAENTPIKQMKETKTDLIKTKKGMTKTNKDVAKSTRNTPKATRKITKVMKQDTTKMKQDITKSKNENKTESPKKNTSKAKENRTEAKDSINSKKSPTKAKKGKTKTKEWELKLSEGDGNESEENSDLKLDLYTSNVESVSGEPEDMFLYLKQNLPGPELDGSSKGTQVNQKKRSATVARQDTTKAKKTEAKSTGSKKTAQKDVAKSSRSTIAAKKDAVGRESRKDATKSNSSKALAKKDINKKETAEVKDSNKTKRNAGKSKKDTVKGSREGVGPKVSLSQSEQSNDELEMESNTKESELLMSESSDSLASYLEQNMPPAEFESSGEDES